MTIQTLEQLAGIDFNDSEICVSIDHCNHILDIKFDSAWDSQFETYIDGNLYINGWSGIASTPERNILSDHRPIEKLKFISNQSFFGNTYRISGASGDSIWGVWDITSVEIVDLHIHRRFRWIENDLGGYEYELPVTTDNFSLSSTLTQVVLLVPAREEHELEKKYTMLSLEDAKRRGENAIVCYITPRTRNFQQNIVNKNFELTSVEVVSEFTSELIENYDGIIVYTDLGVTENMDEAIISTIRANKSIRYRRLFELHKAQQFIMQNRHPLG